MGEIGTAVANIWILEMSHTVRVGEKHHPMEADSRSAHVEFESHAAAVNSAQEIIESQLTSSYTPGMSAEALYQSYTSFGEDSVIVGPEGTRFSVWEYAKTRCDVIAARPPNLRVDAARPPNLRVDAFERTIIGVHYSKVLLFVVVFLVLLPALLVLSALAYIVARLFGLLVHWAQKVAMR